MQKIARSHDRNPEGCHPIKVLAVERDDVCGPRRQSTLEDKIVIGVAEKGAPTKVDECLPRDRKNRVNKLSDLLRRVCRNLSGAMEHVIILET